MGLTIHLMLFEWFLKACNSVTIYQNTFKFHQFTNLMYFTGVLPDQKKSQMSLLTAFTIGFGICSTVDVYHNLLVPRVFIIRDFPLSESVRPFHRLRTFSSLLTRWVQLNSVRSPNPCHTPRILILSVTQRMATGLWIEPLEEPIQIPSDLSEFSRAPDAFSYIRMSSKVFLIEYESRKIDSNRRHIDWF